PRDFQDQQAPAWLQDASKLEERDLELGDVAKGVAHAHAIEMAGAKRQRLGSGLHERARERLPGLLEHAAAGVHPDDAARLAEHVKGGSSHETRAGGDINE